MAIIYPSFDIIDNLKRPPTEGENQLLRFLYDYFKDDNRYEIYFQPYLNGDIPDVVLMRENAGILIFEVKDWNLEHYHINEKGDWILKNNNAKLKSPIEQVNQYRSDMIHLHIEGLLQKTLTEKNYYAIVNSCIFFSKASEKEIYEKVLNIIKETPKKKSVSYLQIMGNNSLNKETFELILGSTRLNIESNYFNEGFAKSLRRNLKPPIHFIEDGIRINYTESQTRLIESEAGKRQKIKGVAGSGKTLVLAKRAVNAHLRTNKKVLILTYNLSLVNYIHDKISDVREKFKWENFHIINYHRFFVTESRNYGVPIGSLIDFDNPKHFENVKDKILKYSSILIDEVQDYQEEWLLLITNYFLEPGGELVVFGDEKQNIYDRELDNEKKPKIPTIVGAWNESLKEIHRFSSDITLLIMDFQKLILAKKYNIDLFIEGTQLSALDDSVVEYHPIDHFNSKKIAGIIHHIITENEIHSSDVCVLSTKVDTLRNLDFELKDILKEKTTTTFETQDEYNLLKAKYEIVDDLAITEDNNPINEDSEEKTNIQVFKSVVKNIRRQKKLYLYMKTGFIKLSTIHSFKGWEIPTLFLIIDEDTNFTNAELIYTGLTRARFRVYIINSISSDYHSFFSDKVSTIIDHVPKNKFIKELENDNRSGFILKGKKPESPEIKIGDNIKLKNVSDGFMVKSFKTYGLKIVDGFKFNFYIKIFEDNNSTYLLTKGEKILNEFQSGSYGKWISYYREVTGIYFKGVFSKLDDNYLNILNVNGIRLNNYNNNYFVISENDVDKKIKIGHKINSINGMSIEGMKIIDVHYLLFNLTNSQIVITSTDQINNQYEIEIESLKYSISYLTIWELNKKTGSESGYIVRNNLALGIPTEIKLMGSESIEMHSYTEDRLFSELA